MSNLTSEDLSSLITFYKNKNSELELQFLILQIESNKKYKILEEKYNKELEEYQNLCVNQTKILNVEHRNEVAELKKEIAKLIKNKQRKSK